MIKNNYDKTQHQMQKDRLSRPMSLTVKAVVVNRETEEVLLLKRSKKVPWNAGKWDLPGGHVDEGESVEEAIKREVREETGLEVELDTVIKVSEFPKESRQFRDEKRGLRYLAFLKEGQNPQKVKLNKREHSEFQWLSLQEAIKLMDEEDGFEKEKRETLSQVQNRLESLNSKESWVRAAAELDNFRKRAEREKEEFRKYATEDLLLDLLPVVDNFEASVAFVPEDQQDNSWVTGIMHIKNQLLRVLEDRGLEEISTQPGDPIDASIHEVVGGKGEQVGKVLKKGYRLNGKVVRAASIEAG
jgi:molecular chaperone GrpE